MAPYVGDALSAAWPGWLDRRSVRLPVLLLGMLFASERRTVTSWFRGAGITADFRQSYVTVCAVGCLARWRLAPCWPSGRCYVVHG